MKYQWLLLFTVLLLKGFAGEEKSLTERVEFLEEKRGYRFKERGFQIILKGDLLYWKADVDGVAYATTSIQTAESGSAAGTTSNHIKTRTPHFSYDPGFRVGIGLESPYDFLDFFLLWTRFYTEGHDQAHASFVPTTASPGDRLIYSNIGLIKSLVSNPNRAKAECDIKENIVDLQCARGIEVSRHFFMRPYFGLRCVWSDIDWDVRFERNFLTPLAANQDETELKVDNDYHAIGGLVGVELNWKAFGGFGVHMRGAGALVWGEEEERTKQKYTFLPAGSLEEVHQVFKARNSFHCLKGLWELFIGAFWEKEFTGKKVKEHLVRKGKMQHSATLRLFAGYEMQQWPWVGQKTITQSTRERDRHSLGFQGFTGGVELVF